MVEKKLSLHGELRNKEGKRKGPAFHLSLMTKDFPQGSTC
jgi:hypothetical protein